MLRLLMSWRHPDCSRTPERLRWVATGQRQRVAPYSAALPHEIGVTWRLRRAAPHGAQSSNKWGDAASGAGGAQKRVRAGG